VVTSGAVSPRVEAAFWDRVEVTSGCWLWTGHINEDGYGRLGSRHAHRFAYALLVGPIPAGFQLDHLCRVRRAVGVTGIVPTSERRS
jgi:hypothetical protein